jgi:hypothetical protein
MKPLLLEIAEKLEEIFSNKQAKDRLKGRYWIDKAYSRPA